MKNASLGQHHWKAPELKTFFPTAPFSRIFLNCTHFEVPGVCHLHFIWQILANSNAAGISQSRALMSFDDGVIVPPSARRNLFG